MDSSHAIVQRRLQVLVACLVSLGSCLLGMGQGDFVLPLVTVIAAGAAIYITDMTGWLKLPRLAANIAALIAVALSGLDFFRFRNDVQLLAVANLLVYLEVILLFQSKNSRLYWQLIVLSLLQVVVGSAINLGVGFGLLLVVYLLLAIATVHLLFLHTEIMRWEAAGAEAIPTPLLTRTQRRIAARKNVETSSVARTMSKPSGLSALSSGRVLRRHVASWAGVALAVTALIFIYTPRTARSSLRAGFVGMQRVVGFSEKVTLGTLGEVSQNPEIVMRVKFFDGQTGEPYKLMGEPLFRGSVVGKYSHGAWSHKDDSGTIVTRDLPMSDHWVRQEVTVEPLDHDLLFTVYTPFRLADSRHRDQLRRNASERMRQFQYNLGVDGLRGGFPVAIVPCLEAEASISPDEWRPHAELTRLPDAAPNQRDPLANLKATAARWLQAAGLPAKDRVGRARVLVSRLRAAPFEYTLEPQQRDPALDPIEDFVTNNPRGHCEYYATALALMLRSQGMPARVVIGYKGADWNAMGGFYQVRQLNAHAWVEAYLAPAEVPADELARDPRLAQGGWLVLDPTPGDADSLEARSSWQNSLRDFSDYMKLMWSNYVVGMNSERQQDSIYQPLSERMSGIFHGLFDPEAWGASWRRMRDWFAGGTGADDEGEWLSWHVGVLFFVALLAGLRWRKQLGAAIARWRAPAAISQQHGATEVEFYRRLEDLLARYGLVRAPAQTPREFALASSVRLAQLPTRRAAADLPRRIVEAFYRVRYGGHALDNRATEQVEHALSELELALARDAGK